MRRTLLLLLLGGLLVIATCSLAFGQSKIDDEVDARADPGTISARLTNKDPRVRQQAAESLAKLAAVDQKKMLEAYRLQEKDDRVRLALDWALFRIGNNEALYRVVRQLDSDRHDQAVSYLEQLDSPAILHGFLKSEIKRPKITTGIIEALSKIGDSDSLELLTAYKDSFSPGVAAAAEVAAEQIESRLAQVNNPLPGRPRTITTAEKKEP